MAKRILENLLKDQEENPLYSTHPTEEQQKLARDKKELTLKDEPTKLNKTRTICAINESELDKVELAFFKRPLS